MGGATTLLYIICKYLNTKDGFFQFGADICGGSPGVYCYSFLHPGGIYTVTAIGERR